MIKMKALRSFGYAGVNEGAVGRGHEFSARDLNRAKELETHGLAYRIEARLPPRVAPIVAVEENKASRDGPLPSVGGPTGAAIAPSSLLPDHPPLKRRSRRSRASRES